MSFKYLSAIAKDEPTVKFIFDNIRNLGLVALLLGAGQWKLSNFGSSSYQYYSSHIYGYLLYCIGFILMFINLASAIHKIRDLKYSGWIKGICGGLYGSLIFEVINFIAFGKHL